MNVTGAASLAGTLRLELLNGFTPAAANTFTIFTAASRTGTFSSVTGTGNGLVPDYRATSVVLAPGASIPTITIGDVTVTEGNNGATPVAVTFTLTLSNASQSTIQVTATTANGTAQAGVDYTAVTATIEFAPGVTSRPLTVLVNSDTLFEPDETILVNLTSPVNATIADAQGVATITNDDVQGGAFLVAPVAANGRGPWLSRDNRYRRLRVGPRLARPERHQ